MHRTAQLLERLREDPHDDTTRLELAALHLDRGEAAEAFLQLRLVAVSETGRGELRRLLARAHLRSHDLAAAVEDLMAACRAFPDDPLLEAALGEAFDDLMDGGATVERLPSARIPSPGPAARGDGSP